MADFYEFMTYAAVGLIAAVIVFVIPRQSRAGRRIALVLLALSLAYPLGIVFFLATRKAYGETYGWIIMGIGWGFLIAGISGLLLLFWTWCLVAQYRRVSGKSAAPDDG